MNITYINQDSKAFRFGNEIKRNNLADKHGSAIAVYAAKLWAKDDPFVVLNGDDLCVYDDGTSISKEVIDAYKATGDTIIYGKEMPRDQIWRYSSMRFSGTEDIGSGAIKISDIIEKPETGTEPSNIMGFARYVFQSDVFDEIEKVKPRKNGEFCITDVVQNLAKKGRVSTVIFDGRYFDCGSKSGAVLASNYFGLKDQSTRDQILTALKEMIDGEQSKNKKFDENEKIF